MPIDVTICDRVKLVHAICAGLVTKEELYHHQDSIWCTSKYAGYDCIFDMFSADFCKIQYIHLLKYSRKAAVIDYGCPPTKLAVVISTNQQKILTEFYQAGVDLSAPTTREMKNFYTLGEAKDWIELVSA